MAHSDVDTLKQLLAGIDPVSARPLDDASPYRGTEIVAALRAAVEALEGHGQMAGPARSGKPWTREEERLLIQRFEANEVITAIAARLQRSAAAITARLVQLELIQPPAGFKLRFGPRAHGDD